MAELGVEPARIGTLARRVAAHRYFSDWSPDALKGIEPHSHFVAASPDATLIELNELCPFEFFLLEGALALENENGDRHDIRADDVDGQFPVAHLRPSRYRVTATTPATLLRVERSKVTRQRDPQRARFSAEQRLVGGSFRNHPLVVDLTRRLRASDLPVPPLPGVAVKIRRAMDDPNFTMDDIARIVAADPAVAARLIRVANSASFGGQAAAETVQAAVIRLGLERTQNLVHALAAKSLFDARPRAIKKRMQQRWRHAIEIAALSAVLARLTPDMDADVSLLVGLLHEIGAVPVLKLAEKHPDLAETPALLDEVLEAVVGEVSVHVLEQWGFGTQFVEAARVHDDWYRDHDSPADPTDAVIVAHLHALVREREFRKLPRIDETPAFGRLALGKLSPRLSLTVLDEAETQVRELKGLLA